MELCQGCQRVGIVVSAGEDQIAWSGETWRLFEQLGVMLFDRSKMGAEVGGKLVGIGIAEKDIPMLFGDFTQLDGSHARRHGGTGLGLAISQRLIWLSGARARARFRNWRRPGNRRY